MSTGDATDHLERRNRYKDFYSTLQSQQPFSQYFAEELIDQNIHLSMCDTWSEIRKDSSKALRSLVSLLPPSTAERLMRAFLSPLTQHLSVPETQTQTTGGEVHTDRSWQHVHGNLLGLFALIPLLPSLENIDASSLFRTETETETEIEVEQVKAVCLEALSHPQLPVRETAQRCLQEVGQHCGSLGKRFLGQCLVRIGVLAGQDVREGVELHASELDGLLQYVGCLVTTESALLLGVLEDASMVRAGAGAGASTGKCTEAMVVAVLRQVHLCMQHSSSTVRQRAASVAIVCCTFPITPCVSAGPDAGADAVDLLRGKGEYVSSMVDTIIDVVSNAERDWRVSEGYMVVVETLLLELLTARVSILRLEMRRVTSHETSADSQHAPLHASSSASPSFSSAEGNMYMDILRLIAPLILYLTPLARHTSFEVRRVVSQLIPTLARVVLLCPPMDVKRLYPTIFDINEEGEVACKEIHVGECLPFVVFVNEMLRSVAYLQELQRDRTHEQRAGLIMEPSEASTPLRDAAKEVHVLLRRNSIHIIHTTLACPPCVSCPAAGMFTQSTVSS